MLDTCSKCKWNAPLPWLKLWISLGLALYFTSRRGTGINLFIHGHVVWKEWCSVCKVWVCSTFYMFTRSHLRGRVWYINMFAQAETQMRQRQSNQWAPAVKFRANAIRMQVVVNPYSTSTVSLTLEGWEPLSSLTWMKHGHRVNMSTSSHRLLQPAEEVNACTWTHMYTCTHAVKEQPGMHKPPASIFHYYNTVGWRQGWAVLHCSCTQAEYARWAVTDTRPQTRVVTKKYRKDPAGGRKRANVV